MLLLWLKFKFAHAWTFCRSNYCTSKILTKDDATYYFTPTPKCHYLLLQPYHTYLVDIQLLRYTDMFAKSKS